MLSRSLLVAVLLLAFPPGDGSKDGRQGNVLYEQEDYAAAAAAYEAGLEAYGDGEPGAVPAGLLNNLGMAHHRQEDYEAAKDAFTRSMGMAATETNYARAAYNAGNNAFAMQDLQGAVDFYKKALLANPDDEAAKFNYEYVKRQLDQQQQQQQPENITPSDYAKQLKEQAEALVAQQRYREAYNLMERGMAEDPTVRAFQGFIDRIGSVADIDEG